MTIILFHQSIVHQRFLTRSSYVNMIELHARKALISPTQDGFLSIRRSTCFDSKQLSSFPHLPIPLTTIALTIFIFLPSSSPSPYPTPYPPSATGPGGTSSSPIPSPTTGSYAEQHCDCWRKKCNEYCGDCPSLWGVRAPDAVSLRDVLKGAVCDSICRLGSMVIVVCL